MSTVLDGNARHCWVNWCSSASEIMNKQDSENFVSRRERYQGCRKCGPMGIR